MSESGKYTAFSTRALNVSGHCKIRHADLANIAKLKSSISRKPKPPAYFGCVIDSQETQQVLLLPSLLPHQNLRSIELMCSHKPLGSLKQDIEKVGTA
jgi:hypothetical protein